MKVLNFIERSTGVKHFIGKFQTAQQVDGFLASLFAVTKLNDKQFLLLLNDPMEVDKEPTKQLVAVCDSVAEVQTFLNESYEILDDEESEEETED